MKRHILGVHTHLARKAISLTTFIGALVSMVEAGTWSMRRRNRGVLHLRGGVSDTLIEPTADTSATQKSSETTPGIVFDIDGVFKFGGLWDHCGLPALRRVQAAGTFLCERFVYMHPAPIEL